ncbi:hypothetical protein IWQ60_005529, partial [Tieghemiomyces parasiticus]
SIRAFIKYAIREKMLESYTKGKDISEVLRDNSMSTMLLVTYTQTEGRGYLLSLLQPCLQRLQAIVKDCEIDPLRVDPDRIAVNRQNLHTACRVILDTVIEAKGRMPFALQAMCALIRKEVIRLWQISISYNQHLADPTRKRCKSYDFRTRSRMPQAGGPPGHPTTAGTREGSSAMVDTTCTPNAALSSHPPLVNLSDRHQRFSNLDLPVLDDAAVSGDFADDLTRQLQTILEESAHYRQSSWAATSTTASDRFSVESPVALEFLSRCHSTAADRKSAALRKRLTQKATFDSPDSEVEFNAIEKVLGTLLFIRFLIPTMTAPEISGLPPEPSSKARRGFVLCAKVLAALCNGIEFGSKEGYMFCMNPFLRESRPKLRRYLQEICTVSDPNQPMSTGGTASTGPVGNAKRISGDVLARFSRELRINPNMDVSDYLAQHLESAFSIDDFETRCSLHLGENLGLVDPSIHSRPSRVSSQSHDSFDSGTTHGSTGTALGSFGSISTIATATTHGMSASNADAYSEDDLLLFVYHNIDNLITDCAARSQGTDDWPEIDRDLQELREVLGNFTPELQYLQYTMGTGRRTNGGWFSGIPPATHNTTLGLHSKSGSHVNATTAEERYHSHRHNSEPLTPLSNSPDFLRMKSPFTALTFANVFKGWNRSADSPPPYS